LEGSSLRDWLQAGGLELDMHPYRSRKEEGGGAVLAKLFRVGMGGLGWEPPQCRRPRLIHSTDGRRTEVTKEETL
jgi:hypothetical protein